ncbi:MAG: EamA family transporter [Paracoccaceae bacterium]
MSSSSSAIGSTKQFSALVLACLAIVYFVWGSTYLAIALVLETMPPLLMTSARFVVAGVFMIVFLAVRGSLKIPTTKELFNCTLVGGAMLGLGVGGIGIAEQTISSGLASVGIATVPIWAVLFAGLFARQWPNQWEISGICLGFAGVFLLNLQSGFGSGGIGAIIIVLAALFWALGSVASKIITLPEGPSAYAFEMLMGGLAIGIIGFAANESFSVMPSVRSFSAWLFLVVGGSLFAYSAYMYLLQTVRTSVATSYAFVTPVVAILLGVYFLGETLDLYSLGAMVCVIAGVLCIFRGKEESP